MRPAATLLLTIAMALGAVGLAFALPALDAPSSATVRITNSLEGRPVFGGGALRPGDTVSGTVRIGNAGNVLTVVTVSATRTAQTGSVSLSDSLQLTVADTATNLILFAGPASAFTTVAVGALPVGGSRELRFTATLPRTAGNGVQGASTTLGLQWSAAAAPGATPTATATPKPVLPVRTATPTPPRTTPVKPARVTATGAALADAIGMPRVGTKVRKRKLRMRLYALDGAKVLVMQVKVNGKTRKRVKGSRAIVKVNLKKLRGRRVKVAVTIRASDGRRYTAKRTYKVARKRR